MPKQKKKEFHGHAANGSRSREYAAWADMIQRCHNCGNRRYAAYGGRGITVCDRWRNSFAAFISDMGPRPSPGHSLDRIDNNRGYEPSNCRWATMKTQGRNRCTNRLLTVNGETKTVAEWVENAGINRSTFAKRMRKGMTVQDALFKPVNNQFVTSGNCRPTLVPQGA